MSNSTRNSKNNSVGDGGFFGSTTDSSPYHIVQYFIKFLPSFPKSLVGVSLFCLFDMKDSPLVRFTVALDAVELLEE